MLVGNHPCQLLSQPDLPQLQIDLRLNFLMLWESLAGLDTQLMAGLAM